MIRRVLKDIRETWPYWSVLIWAALAGSIYLWLDTTYWKTTDDWTVRFDWLVKVKALGTFLLFMNYLCVLLIAVTLFGAEFRHQTMARLLAQPVSRSRIWWEKTLSFFLIIFMVLVSQCIAFSVLWRIATAFGFHAEFSRFRATASLYLLVGGWFCAVALASGVLMSLWLRQTHTAFWAALVLPPAAFLVCYSVDLFLLAPLLHVSPLGWIVSKTPALFGKYSEDTTVFFMVIALWSCVAYPLAWLKFKKLEV